MSLLNSDASGMDSSVSQMEKKKVDIAFKSLVLDAVIFWFLALSVISMVGPETEGYIDLQYYSFLSLGLLVVGGALSYVLQAKAGIKTLGQSVFAMPQFGDEQSQTAWYLSFSNWELALAFVFALKSGIAFTDFSLIEIFDANGIEGVKRILTGILTPDFHILPRAVEAVVQTIFIAFMATVLAVPIAFVLSFLCAKNIMSGNSFTFGIYTVLRLVTNITRSIEALVWAIVFTVWVGVGPFAGMLALFLHSVASLTKNFSELAEGISDGPVEGIKSTGAGPLQVVWFAVVTQIVLPYTAFAIYRWDINVRMATIIGLVGGGGIGDLLIEAQGQLRWGEVGTLVIVIAVVVWLMDAASAYLREAIK